MLGCGCTIYTPQQTTYVSLPSLLSARTSQQEGSAQPELIAVIQNFLKDVPKNERATFDRFFADDVIYTRGTGQVVTKNDKPVMRTFRNTGTFMKHSGQWQAIAWQATPIEQKK